MALPKIDVPTYETTLISSGKKVKYRPFLVKEQKLFLMASQSTDEKETVENGISNFIKSSKIFSTSSFPALEGFVSSNRKCKFVWHLESRFIDLLGIYTLDGISCSK